MSIELQLLTSQLSSDEVLSLRGGLKGRIAEEVCNLDAQADALIALLERKAPDSVRNPGIQMLREMKTHIASLERLSENAAELALGLICGSGGTGKPAKAHILDGYLRDFAECANEELALIHHPMRVVLEDKGSVWANFEEACLDGMLLNLISNAAQHGASHVWFSCMTAPDQYGVMEYRDDSEGLNESAVRLLRDSRLDRRFLESGWVGLLFVRECIRTLRWELLWQEQPPERGVLLRFRIPPFVQDEQINLEDDTLARTLREDRLRYLLRREFLATLPGAAKHAAES